MAGRVEPHHIVLRGALRDIALYVASNGACQVDEYFRDPSRDSEAKAFRKLTLRLSESGRIHNSQQFRHEGGGIWGIKLKNQIRVACFQDGRIWICTHAFQKNGNWRSEDLARANAIRKDYFQRRT